MGTTVAVLRNCTEGDDCPVTVAGFECGGRLVWQIDSGSLTLICSCHPYHHTRKANPGEEKEFYRKREEEIPF